MKKIAIVFPFLSLLLLCSSLDAQDEFRFGFEVSPSFSWLRTDDNQINSNGTNLGLRLALDGEKYFAENYAFTFGIGFAFNQGGTLKHDIGGNFWTQSDLSDDMYNDLDNALPDGVNLKYGLQYVEIPVGFKMRTQEFGYFKLFAELPRFIIGFRAQSRGAIDGGGIEPTEKEDIKKDVNPLSLSWGLGAGAEYTINENTAIVGGIYFQNGFTDVSKDKGNQYVENDDGTIETPSENSKATLGAITIRIGVLF